LDRSLEDKLRRAVQEEPFSRRLGMNLKEMREGFARVEMIFDPLSMANIYGKAHGGALYSLIDEAFQLAANSHGWIEVALNVNTTYIAPPEPGSRLTATAKLTATSKKTATYHIQLKDEQDRIIAVCQALSYRIERTPLL